jgi:sulfur-carrier protein
LPVRVLIPGPLRRLTGDRAEMELEGANVREVILALEAASPGLRNKLTNSSGGIRRFIRLFLNDEDIDKLGGADTPVKDGDVLTIVPAAAGG